MSNINTEKLETVIAEQVLGWKKDDYFGEFSADWTHNGVVQYEVGEFDPAGNMEHAWLIVEQWEEQRRFFSIYKNATEGYVVLLGENDFIGEKKYAEHPNAATAICLAALNSKGIDIPAYTEGENLF